MATEAVKTDQVANVEAPAATKEAEKVVENSAPTVEADKPKEDTKKEEKPETQAVVNGGAKAKEGAKDTTAAAEQPAPTTKAKQSNFLSKLKKGLSFKNINIIKKKKSPKTEVTEDAKEKTAENKAPEEVKKEPEVTEVKQENKETKVEAAPVVTATPEKSEDTKPKETSTAPSTTEVKKEEEKAPAETPAKTPDEKVEDKPAEEKKVGLADCLPSAVAEAPVKAEEDQNKPTEEKKAQLADCVPAATETTEAAPKVEEEVKG